MNDEANGAGNGAGAAGGVTLRVVGGGAGDWPLWRDARLAALREAPEAFTPRLADWENGERARWRARLTLPGAHNLVAVRAGRPVGLARGVPARPGVAELRSVWVARAARGRGVGDALLAEVARWARAAGARELRLAVVAGNERALALYRRHGFEAVAGTPDPGADAGAPRQVVMARRLDRG
ncbi:GNAT family N-acetyltransferase [Streptomyces sp. 3MP-14]|uniref:GNAT family N-acetyltransferase n=1 Tax=Streptomyces mimosae TaxID=2586635 RepID=A0A5N6A4U3_9ACTN|nr:MULTISPECIES: GNAT family N-acetyltransferase [Streptomyces]KAB8163814.1 GNAT family N-acetyltransferase [Streptomyces mimosae]KAB8175257.1 GNAT family N-acetyltransferase [Streptomyces sp. 3MP-14]